MTCDTMLFEKNFSKLGELQECSRTVYRLVETQKSGESVYGIQLTEEREGSTRNDILDADGLSREKAIEILTFLYENSVSVSVAREVVEDLLWA